MSGTNNYQIILKSRPGVNAEPSVDNFACEQCPYPEGELQDGQILIRTCYLSVDPALRCMMNEDPGVDYLAAWQPGQRIVGSSGVGVVLQSQHPHLSPGDLVSASLAWPWVLYFTHTYNGGGGNAAAGQEIQKLDKNLFGARPSLAISMVTALTSLIGLWEKAHLTTGANQTLVVSGGAGACGSLAGQMGRLMGCSRVVGICGSDAKCQWLTQDLGFSAAINYKTEDVAQRLKDTCPDGVHAYFDNVGGSISDTVIQQMACDSHIVLCGQISVYNKDVPYPPPIPQTTQQTLDDRHITRERFLVLNYPHRFQDAMTQFLSWTHEGKLKVEETMEVGLENTGRAFVSMMAGGNKGKQVIHVSDPQL